MTTKEEQITVDGSVDFQQKVKLLGSGNTREMAKTMIDSFYQERQHAFGFKKISWNNMDQLVARE